MTDTSKMLMESAGNFTAGFSLVALGENATNFDALPCVSEGVRQMLAYTEEQVNIQQTPSGSYMIEYAHNMERFLEDQSIGLPEAYERICEHHSIDPAKTYIILDKEDVRKVNIAVAQEYGVKLARK